MEASHSQVPFFPRVSTSMHIPIFEKPVDEHGPYRQARSLFIIYETSSSAVLIEERGPIKLVHRFFENLFDDVTREKKLPTVEFLSMRVFFEDNVNFIGLGPFN